MDNIDVKQSRYTRLPLPVQKACKKERMFQTLSVLSAGYRFGNNRAIGYRVQKKPEKECLLKLCISGQGWFQAGNKNYTIGAGDMIVCREYTAHGYGADSDNPWELYWVYFQCEYLEELFPELQNKECLILKIDKRQEQVKGFERIIAYMEMGYAKPYLYHAAQYLGLLLASLYQMNRRPFGGDNPIDQAVSYMKTRLDQTLTLEEIAKNSKMSKDHFIRIFYRRTQYTPMDYFIRLKMQKACEKLVTTEDSIKAIADSLGYEDYYYFSRLFKKKIGLSPKAYRQSGM